MLCRVYRQSAGGFVLVPDCMLASREVERQLGPLRDSVMLDLRVLPPHAAAAIQRDFDAQSFSLLPDDGSLGLEFAFRRAS